MGQKVTCVWRTLLFVGFCLEIVSVLGTVAVIDNFTETE